MEIKTQFEVHFKLMEGQGLHDALSNFAEPYKRCFDSVDGENYIGFFDVTDSSPILADTELLYELTQVFPGLMDLKTFNSATFSFTLGIGRPAPEFYTLAPQVVAMLAALGAEVNVLQNERKK